MELTELFCQASTEGVTKAWQDMLISFSRHHFPHQQKTSTGWREMQHLALLVSMSQEDGATALASFVRCGGLEYGQHFINRVEPHKPGKE